MRVASELSHAMTQTRYSVASLSVQLTRLTPRTTFFLFYSVSLTWLANSLGPWTRSYDGRLRLLKIILIKLIWVLSIKILL